MFWAGVREAKRVWRTFGSGKRVRAAVSVRGGDLIANRRRAGASKQVPDVRYGFG